MSVTIVDYGLGNIQAFCNIYKRLNISVKKAKNTYELSGAQKIILPGVGAFDYAMSRLHDSGMRDCLDDLALIKKIPILGICVGMQIMALRSDEGKLNGLGWFDAEVRLLSTRVNNKKIVLPHMGWNDTTMVADQLFNGIVAPQFYFLHSYYFSPNNTANILAKTNYHKEFASAVRNQNIYAVQFHPEKSHHWGVQLLKNFAEL